MNKRILNKVAAGILSPKEAFNLIYGYTPKKARFVRIQFNIKDKITMSYLLNSLFIFPIPIVFGKYFIKYGLRKKNIPTTYYDEIIKVAGNTNIVINSKDADIYLHIY